jgi:hypothetical protein
MRELTYLTLALLAAISAWSQVAPSATGGDLSSDESTEMATPPPVNDAAFPTAVGAEERSNYLLGSIGVQTGYVDNLYAGGTGGATSETTYSVVPMISYNQTTPRQHRLFTYSPSFAIYSPTSALNEFDQGATVNFTYRMTPHTTLSANDAFQKSSGSSGLSTLAGGGAVSSSPQSLSANSVAPFTNRLTNAADAQLSFQFSPMGMIGGSGMFTQLHYPNPAQTSGLYDSDSQGGSAFYNRRISETQYAGANYQYARTLAYPANAVSQTQTQTVYAFYTIYPKHNLSISLSGGPQRYEVAQSSFPKSSGWGPMVIASMGWQGLRTSASASYSREVMGGGGLLGAFVSTSANASARWQISRTWTTAASAIYAINKSVTPFLPFAQPEGHTISGFLTLRHSFSSQLSLQFEYDRVHQSYGGIASISNNPNTNREMISLFWQFAHPLGR